MMVLIPNVGEVEDVMKSAKSKLQSIEIFMLSNFDSLYLQKIC